MADLIKVIELWIQNLLLGWGAGEGLTLFILQALGSVLVVMPPLCITEDQLDQVMDAIEAGIEYATG
jgi:acetylornithine/succinyldiaminopimelate/putrescine aminotransferase